MMEGQVCEVWQPEWEYEMVITNHGKMGKIFCLINRLIQVSNYGY